MKLTTKFQLHYCLPATAIYVLRIPELQYYLTDPSYVPLTILLLCITGATGNSLVF